MIILNIFFIRWFFYDVDKEEFLYEGQSTVNAANNFFKLQLNPYATKTDQDVDVEEFAGYKYMPLMFFIYAPLSIPLGKTGIFFTNIIFYIGTLIISLLLIKKVYKSKYVIKKYIFFFLACYILTFELFYQGVNDIIPIFFILCSILFFVKSKKILSGIFLGLSISTKIFPGIFLLIMFLLGKKFRSALSSLAVIAIAVIPFLLWNFLAFFVNIIYFNVIRLPNPSSIFYFMPYFIQKIWIFVLILILGFLFYRWYISDKSVHNIIYYFIMISTTFLLMNKVTHRNYLIWVLPFFFIFISKKVNIIPMKNEVKNE